MKRELWKEFISNTLEECGEQKLSENAINALVDCVQTTIENMWMIDGSVDRDARPSKDSMQSEIKSLKEEIKSLSEQLLIYRKSVSERRRVPLEDVQIEHGTVIYGHELGR